MAGATHRELWRRAIVTDTTGRAWALGVGRVLWLDICAKFLLLECKRKMLELLPFLFSDFQLCYKIRAILSKIQNFSSSQGMSERVSRFDHKPNNKEPSFLVRRAYVTMERGYLLRQYKNRNAGNSQVWRSGGAVHPAKAVKLTLSEFFPTDHVSRG